MRRFDRGPAFFSVTPGFVSCALELLEAGASAEVRGVQAVSILRDLEYQGSFSCDDQRLNKIWSVGAATVHLCMQTALWDGIKRGQSVWAGDLFPASMVVSTVFGEQPVVAASLDKVRDKNAGRLDRRAELDEWNCRVFTVVDRHAASLVSVSWQSRVSRATTNLLSPSAREALSIAGSIRPRNLWRLASFWIGPPRTRRTFMPVSNPCLCSPSKPPSPCASGSVKPNCNRTAEFA